MMDFEKKRKLAFFFRFLTIACVVVFWIVTIGLAFYYYKNRNAENIEQIVVWLLLSQTGVMFCTAISGFVGRSFRRELAKKRAKTEREHINTLEIVSTLCAGYNGVFYTDLLSGEVKLYRLNEVMMNRMGPEFTDGRSFEWYVDSYKDRLVCEEYREEFAREVNPDNLREKLKDREYYTYTYLGDLNGRNNYFQMKAAKVNGSENHLVIGFADVDEEIRGNMEQQEILRNALEQTREANKIKDTILTNIATEIMEPVGSIVEIARMLSANEANSDSVKSSGKHILMDTENLGMMLNDIMEMNRIRSEQFVFKKERTDISQMVEQVYLAASARAKEKRVSFEFKKDIVHNIVLCDTKRVTEVLQHVCNFVAEFSYEDSLVTVSIRETKAVGRNVGFEIEVGNNGHGQSIDARLLKAISEPNGFDEICFNPYYNQVLGIYLSKTIVELKGASFDIISNDSEGTRITINVEFGAED